MTDCGTKGRVTLSELRAQAIGDLSVPDALREILAKGAALESIVLDDRGRWHHQGERFENPRLSRLFHRGLRRTTGGTWLIELPPYRYPVVVEGFGAFIEQLSTVDDVATARDKRGATFEVSWDTLTVHNDTTLSLADDRGFAARLVEQAYQAIAGQLELDELGRMVVRLGSGRVVVARSAG